ncbi:hypothetical protein FGO68_gene4299 [Halteria grandinella]|uniref:Uncharacterized protein n=1 Tax=Halteria grandinella TaxID=5974 RepID=A0A8J8NZK1_HALGN|nr:hypothetical protein FGO68_gene4299 [Halteria grandinella]
MQGETTESYCRGGMDLSRCIVKTWGLGPKPRVFTQCLSEWASGGVRRFYVVLPYSRPRDFSEGSADYPYPPQFEFLELICIPDEDQLQRDRFLIVQSCGKTSRAY